jgi:transcriptional regulator with XRE-family HTH domain
MQPLGSYIRDIRKEKKISMAKLSKYAGNVSRSELSNIETGKRKNPNPMILQRIAAILGISFEELLFKAGYISRPLLGEFDKELYVDISGLSPESRRAAKKFVDYLYHEEKNYY